MFGQTFTRIALALIVAYQIVVPPRLGGQHGGTPLLDTPDVTRFAGARPAWISVSREGLLLASRDRSETLRVHGYTQADARFFLANFQDRSTDVLLFRRVRPLIEGTLGNRVAFRFMPDFGEGNTVLQEAYLEWSPVPEAKLRLGKFKVPAGLEVLRSDRELTFPERSLASDFVPLRDLGVQFEGSLLNSRITCQAGYFSGAEDGTNANFEWKGTAVGVERVFVLPFRESNNLHIRPLGVGVSASEGKPHSDLPSFKTVGQQTFFRYLPNADAEGLHERVSPQAYYFRGPFGLLSEYVLSRGGARAGADRRQLTNAGWQLAGSVVLTGEQNTYDGVKPSHSFEPVHAFAHPGAWEVAFRHSEANLDQHAFPLYADPAKSAQAAHESAAGVSWYVNRCVKLMAFYENTTFRHNAVGATPLVSEHLVSARMQLAF